MPPRLPNPFKKSRPPNPYNGGLNNKSLKRRLPEVEIPEIVSPQRDLVRIGDTPFYATPNEPREPDWENPFSLAPIALNTSIVADACNLGIQFQGTLAFINLPAFQITYRYGDCPEPPPPPQPPPLPTPDIGFEQRRLSGCAIDGARWAVSFYSYEKYRYDSTYYEYLVNGEPAYNYREIKIVLVGFTAPTNTQNDIFSNQFSTNNITGGIFDFAVTRNRQTNVLPDGQTIDESFSRIIPCFVLRQPGGMFNAYLYPINPDDTESLGSIFIGANIESIPNGINAYDTSSPRLIENSSDGETSVFFTQTDAVNIVCGYFLKSIPIPPPPPKYPRKKPMDCCPETLQLLRLIYRKTKPLPGKYLWVDLEVPIVSCQFNEETKEYEPLRELTTVQVYATVTSNGLEDETGSNILNIQGMYEAAARIAEDTCLGKNRSDESVAVVPEWWQRRIEGGVPQLVIALGDINQDTGKIGYSHYSLSIPHFMNVKPLESPVPRFKKGNFQLLATFRDNSKIIINAFNEFEAMKVYTSILPFCDPNMVTDIKIKKGFLDGYGFKEVWVGGRFGRYFSQGTRKYSPDWSIYW